jgi:Coenzyme PQQ synthesis protein D (PqqD)
MEAEAGYIRTTILNDGAVLVDLQRRACFRLNERGTLIWLRLCEGKSITEIACEMQERLGYTEDPIGFVESFVAAFRKAELFATSLPLRQGEN